MFWCTATKQKYGTWYKVKLCLYSHTSHNNTCKGRASFSTSILSFAYFLWRHVWWWQYNQNGYHGYVKTSPYNTQLCLILEFFCNPFSFLDDFLPFTFRLIRAVYISHLQHTKVIFNPLPSLTLQSTRNLNVACRPKRSKALLLSSS